MAWLLLAAGTANGTTIQTPVDQADPGVVTRELRRQEQAPPSRKPTIVEPRRVPSVDLGKAVTVGAIRIDGARVLPRSAFAAVIDRYVGRELTPKDLRRLASDVANVARRRGYGLATAWIPEQRLANGILRVTIDEGHIDEVRATGTAAAAVRRVLAKLATGEPVKTARLERQLLLAEDIAGVNVGKARLQRDGRRTILIVQTSRDRITTQALIDNWGSATVGRLRAQLTVDINGLISDNDRLTLGVMTTPAQPRELALARLAYSKPIGTGGTQVRVSGYHAVTHAGGDLKPQDIDGKSSFAEISLSHPLLRSRSASLWGYVELGLLDARQQRADVTFKDDRIATIGAMLYGTVGNRHSRVRARLALTRGLDILGSTGGPHPLASRPDGSAIFTKFNAWAAYERQIGSGFSIALQAEGQLASRPLLASEEMGLGGRIFLRGYDYRQASGDKGITGSAELRFDLKGLPKSIGAAQLYLYADAGKVGNYRGGFGSASLASAGGGVRLRIAKHLDAGLEIGVPLRDDLDPTKSSKPRLSFTLGARF